MLVVYSLRKVLLTSIRGVLQKVGALAQVRNQEGWPHDAEGAQLYGAAIKVAKICKQRLRA